MYLRPLVLLTLLVTCISSCHSANEELKHQEVFQSSGLAFEANADIERNLHAIVDSWKDQELRRQGGMFQSHCWWPWGVNGFDFDNDGDVDLYLSHHGQPGGKILINQLAETGQLQFSDASSSMTIPFGLLPGADDRPWFFDFNGDGWLDIAGLSDESRRPYLWNRQGKKFETNKEGRFFRRVSHPIDVTDFNDDGYPDLDAGHAGQFLFDPELQAYSKAQFVYAQIPDNVPDELKDLQQRLKRSNKKNKRLKISYQSHFINGFDTLGRSPSAIDLNGDDYDDMIVSGYGGYGAQYLGYYLLADKNNRLQDATEALGLPYDGCPIFFGDLTGDGKADLLIAGRANGGVYVKGAEVFDHQDNDLTDFLQNREPYLLRAFPADLDNDGDIDFVMSSPRKRFAKVFENKGNGIFNTVFGFETWSSNPIFIADINSDGRLDIVAGGDDRAPSTQMQVFMNQSATDAGYLRLYPRYKTPNPYAIGAVVNLRLRNASGEWEESAKLKARWDGQPVHLGLGGSSEFEVLIEFPDGQQQRYDGLQPNGTYTLYADGKVSDGFVSATK